MRTFARVVLAGVTAVLVAQPALAQNYNYDGRDGGAGAAAFALVCGGIMALIGLLLFILNIWMIIDAATRHEGDFAVGDKVLWLVLLIAGLFLGFGLIVALIYYILVYRPSRHRGYGYAGHRGPHGYGYGPQGPYGQGGTDYGRGGPYVQSGQPYGQGGQQYGPQGQPYPQERGPYGEQSPSGPYGPPPGGPYAPPPPPPRPSEPAPGGETSTLGEKQGETTEDVPPSEEPPAE